ncbi:MAG: hypothetical protein NC182_01375 [Prevotella sp.]|nr:hypothetical protein [Staphylococcus sp.]MCM1349833.1 hypothetical protein [Prevotella sp.]
MAETSMQINMSLDERRKKIDAYIEKARYFVSISHFDEAEKYYLKAVRVSENIYRKTYLENDKNKVIQCYVQISDFCETYSKRMDLAALWYQKIVVTLEDSFESYASVNEYHLLMEWYLKTIDFLKRQGNEKKAILFSIRMRKRAVMLYKKTKTNEDLKFVILSRLFLAEGFEKMKQNGKAYFHYRHIALTMEKLYEETKEEGIKYDLLEIYQRLCEITQKSVFKLFHRKWKMKSLLLKEEKQSC